MNLNEIEFRQPEAVDNEQYLKDSGWLFHPHYFRFQWSHPQFPDNGFVDEGTAVLIQQKLEVKAQARLDLNSRETYLGYHWTSQANIRCDVYAIGEGFKVDFRYMDASDSKETKEIFRATHNVEQVDGVVKYLHRIQAGTFI